MWVLVTLVSDLYAVFPWMFIQNAMLKVTELSSFEGPLIMFLKSLWVEIFFNCEILFENKK